MEQMEGVRIDKWLWAVRLYKTRSLAADACRTGQVEISGRKVKPAREIHVGETVVTRVGEITRTTKVLGLIDKRVGAQAAKAFAEDLTPATEYAKRTESNFQPSGFRARGLGRPTKKERRALDGLF